MDGTQPNSGHYDAAKLQAAGYLEGGIISESLSSGRSKLQNTVD